ncbi:MULTISPECIES: MerR family transcriptional regulator [Pimelobacter]|uniref:MerR family transcriptional regulator n=1 Tax=Pimelobacter TaxID=2044 RepID=UPI001C05C582|nr:MULTISPECIES: MerR family transcriptional regulator [Pimelobacter]MBU2696124.1 MerR family transcriptional regulator [Pimelobacter sp. 30-1]UUW89688.1 MerR family transcriptional regulator [Pimelobacter simplex]UUW93517.1 MerR family transcriptional regulator [Pimelobacter simplex]
MPSTGLPIAEAATTLGLTTDTLRYYEKDGLLLRPVPRASGGHRRYENDDLRWIELVTRLRSTGMPIRDVRRYADLVRAGTGNEEDRLALLHAHRDQVLRQLAEVTAHLAAIEHKIDLYTDCVLERSA